MAQDDAKQDPRGTESGGASQRPFEEAEDIARPPLPDAAAKGHEDVEHRIASQVSQNEAAKDLPRGRGRHYSNDSHSSVDSQLTLPDVAHDHQVPPTQSHSRAQSSVRSVRREAEKVPRSQRRGLLSRLTIVAEVTEPFDYSRQKKWWITFVIAVAGSAAPMATSIILPALVDIARDFHTTATVVNLSVALFMLSMSIFPLWWSSFSETLGRRTVYLVSFSLYLIFNIVGANATSIGMFIATRILSGGAAASVQAVGAGTIADVWEVRERGRAMGVFYLGPLCGPLIAPIIGGAMTVGLGWRSVQWFLAVYGGVILVFIVFALPETLRQRKNVATMATQEAVSSVADSDEKLGSSRPVRPALARTTTAQSVQIKTKKYLSILRRVFVDPLRIILYLQFPAVALCVGYASIVFGSLYMLNVSVQQTFSVKPYNYSSLIVGLLYIPGSLGYFLSSIFGGKWIDKIMAREARNAGRYDDKGRLVYQPEDRMKENAWVAAILYPIALIVYGWTAHFGVSVAAPMVANFFFGVGSMLVFAMVTTMLTEFLPSKSSNGVAVNNFVRNIFSCVGSLLTNPLIEAIGNGWLFTILGIVSLIAGPFAIWAMKRFGPRWRVGMDAKLDKVSGG